MKEIEFTPEYQNEPVGGKVGAFRENERIPNIIGIEGLIEDLAKEIIDPDPDVVKGLDGGEYSRQ